MRLNTKNKAMKLNLAITFKFILSCCQCIQIRFFLIAWVTACERDFVNWPPPQKEYYKCLVWCFGWLQKVVGLISWKSPNNFYTEHLDVFVGHRTVGLFSWKSSNNFYTEHFDVFLLATELLDFSRGSYLITFIQSILVFLLTTKPLNFSRGSYPITFMRSIFMFC